MNDTTGEPPPSIRIIEKTADKKDVDPADLPPLFHVIDADALDRLVASMKNLPCGNLVVEFQYEGCSVTIDETGHVDLSG